MNRFVALPLWLLWSCSLLKPSDYDENDKGPAIRTEKDAYVVSRVGHSLRVTINMAYTNHTGGTVYLPGCHGVFPPDLEKRVDDKWVPAYSPIIPLCLGPPLKIYPGRAYSYTFSMEAWLPTYTGPSFYPEEVEGTYRLVWEIYATWTPDKYPLGKLLPLEQCVSNEFKLSE